MSITCTIEGIKICHIEDYCIMIKKRINPICENYQIPLLINLRLEEGKES
jgi:hypothetical protein